MPRRVEIVLSGEKQLADELDFTQVTEAWNEYQTEDGSFVRVKLVVQKILKLVDKKNIAGEPVYVVASTSVMAASPARQN